MFEKYGKKFDFFKQHVTSHLVKDILYKGMTNQGSMCPDEGFQQEAAEAYNHTKKCCVPNEATQLFIQF